MATFDFGQETLRHEKGAPVQGRQEASHSSSRELPAPWRTAGKWWDRATPDAHRTFIA